MPVQHVTIRINLNGLRANLAQTLQRAILLVAAGLQNLDQIDPEFLELPIFFKMVLDPNLKWTKEEVENRYSEWVLANGFRDAIEAIGALLEEAHRVLSIWDLAGVQAGTMKLSGAQWNEAIVSGVEKFRSLGLPHKIEHLRSSHGLVLEQRLSSHVLSINKARNCLVHRGGIVAKRDITNTAGLTVTWRKLSYLIQDEDGERPLQIGQTLEKGGILCVRRDEHSKSFPVGATIRLTASEFSEVCWSLFLFGEDLTKKINSLGVCRGILNSDAE